MRRPGRTKGVKTCSGALVQGNPKLSLLGPLTPRQQQILRFVEDTVQHKQRGPTSQELRDHIESNTGTKHLYRVARGGYLHLGVDLSGNDHRLTDEVLSGARLTDKGVACLAYYDAVIKAGPVKPSALLAFIVPAEKYNEFLSKLPGELRSYVVGARPFIEKKGGSRAVYSVPMLKDQAGLEALLRRRVRGV